MKFKTVKGKKKEGDHILLVKTDGWEAVTLVDIARMVVWKHKNEQFLYPPPQFQGGKMVIDFLKECVQEPEQIDFIAAKYKLHKGVELRLHHFI